MFTSQRSLCLIGFWVPFPRFYNPGIRRLNLCEVRVSHPGPELSDVSSVSCAITHSLEPLTSCFEPAFPDMTSLKADVRSSSSEFPGHSMDQKTTCACCQVLILPAADPFQGTGLRSIRPCPTITTEAGRRKCLDVWNQ